MEHFQLSNWRKGAQNQKPPNQFHARKYLTKILKLTEKLKIIENYLHWEDWEVIWSRIREGK